jgi:diguanylate cyclase (GGDEF)-like protein
MMQSQYSGAQYKYHSLDKAIQVMKQIISVGIIDVFITRHRQDITSNQLIKQRLVVSIAYACMACITIFVAWISFSQIPLQTKQVGWLACSVAFTALIGILLYLRASSVEKAQTAGHFLVATSSVVLLSTMFVTGGPEVSNASSLLVLIPMMSFFLLGSYAGWGWTILTLGAYGFLLGLTLKGYDFPSHLHDSHKAIGSVFLFYTVMITASFAYVYDQLYRRQLKARLHEQKKFEYMAMHDSLTGLANRKLFDETLQAALARAKREKYSTALLMVDLDHFKPINDLHGHQVGDAILQHVGESLLSVIRSSDLAARIGGDEFAVILEHVTHSDIALVADKMLEAINTKLQFSISGSLEVSCSVGVAISNPKASNEEQASVIYEQADKALYKAKLKRNTWCFVNDSDDQLSNPDISKTINHHTEPKIMRHSTAHKTTQSPNIAD